MSHHLAKLYLAKLHESESKKRKKEERNEENTKYKRKGAKEQQKKWDLVKRKTNPWREDNEFEILLRLSRGKTYKYTYIEG